MDPKHLLGPVSGLAGGRVDGAAARMGQLLRFGQVSLTSPQGQLRALAIFYIRQNLVPFEDVAAVVPLRHGASEEPAIFPIGAANARLELDWLAAR